MNLPSSEELTKKRMEIAEACGLTPLVNALVSKTSKSVETVLCYLSRDPTELGQELKVILIEIMNSLGTCQTGRHVADIVTQNVFAAYVPLYGLRRATLKTNDGLRASDLATVENITAGLRHYERIVRIFKEITSVGFDIKSLKENIETYVNEGGKFTPHDLSWLEDAINNVKRKSGHI